jgi:hypothetical protein
VVAGSSVTLAPRGSVSFTGRGYPDGFPTDAYVVRVNIILVYRNRRQDVVGPFDTPPRGGTFTTGPHPFTGPLGDIVQVTLQPTSVHYGPG